MNRGLLRASDRWNYYTPTVQCAGAGGETHPVFDQYDGTWQFGRYVKDPDTNFVTAEVQLITIGATTLGSGAAYVFRLPVPAHRPVAIGTARNCPVPIGSGMCYWSFVQSGQPWTQIECTPTLADAYASLAGDEDSWFQLYAPYILSWGSESTSSGTYAVTHRAGFAVNARDVEINSTNNALSAAQSCAVVTASDATTFTVRNRAGSAPASAWTFDWKIRAEPPSGQTGAVVSPTVPWDWSRFTSFGPFGSMFIQLGYEAA